MITEFFTSGKGETTHALSSQGYQDIVYQISLKHNYNLANTAKWITYLRHSVLLLLTTLVIMLLTNTIQYCTCCYTEVESVKLYSRGRERDVR